MAVEFIAVKFIKEITEKHFEIEDISIRHRSDELVFVRYVYMKLCRKHLPVSLRKISKEINRNHDAVIHGISKFELYKDQKFFRKYKEGYDKLKLVVESRIVKEEKKECLRNEKIYRMQYIISCDELFYLKNDDYYDLKILINQFLSNIKLVEGIN